MKKKSEGTRREILNAVLFEQEDGFHYTKDDVSEPVVNDITIRIVFILMINDAWWEEFLDVKREFLTGIFDKVEELYTEVPQGMKKILPSECPITSPEKIIWSETSCCTFLERITEII